MGEVKIAGVKDCARSRGTVNCAQTTLAQHVNPHDAVLFERGLWSTLQMTFLTIYISRSCAEEDGWLTALGARKRLDTLFA